VITNDVSDYTNLLVCPEVAGALSTIPTGHGR